MNVYMETLSLCNSQVGPASCSFLAVSWCYRFVFQQIKDLIGTTSDTNECAINWFCDEFLILNLNLSCRLPQLIEESNSSDLRSDTHLSNYLMEVKWKLKSLQSNIIGLLLVPF